MSVVIKPEDAICRISVTALLAGALWMAGIAGAEAAILHVPDPYKTIHEAAEYALPGDTVLVREGDYHENIVVTKSLTIRSEKGPDTTHIRALNLVEPVFKVMDAHEVKIIGFTVSGSVLSGIYLYNSHHSEIRDNKTRENGNGLSLHSSDNNAIVNNIAEANEQSGIYLESSHGNRLQGNRADSNKEKGIFLNSSSHNALVDNSASLNTWNGVTFWASDNNTAQGNKVLRNTYGIVLSNSNDNALRDNATWTNFYIILPVILIYLGVVLYWIQRRVFRYIYSE